jgi:hypothetical protein
MLLKYKHSGATGTLPVWHSYHMVVGVVSIEDITTVYYCNTIYYRGMVVQALEIQALWCNGDTMA